MGGENHRFGSRLEISRPLLIFICASLIAHAALFTAAFLAPEAPPEPSTYDHDCLGPTGSPPPNAPVPTTAALGPRAALHTVYVFGPCCGPGCSAALAVPEPE